MDFGLARAPGLQQITVAKTLVGSIYYASPEQIWGKPLDNRSDIYALGVVLYEMVTGQRPFTGRALQELTQKITAGNALPPTTLTPDLAPELERIILTAMAANRDERYDQASDLAVELRTLQLRAPSVGTIHALEKSPAVSNDHGEIGHNPVPKRPHVSTPHYPPIETLETLPVRERQTPIPDALDDQTGPGRSLSIYDTSPQFPAQTQTPAQEEQHGPETDQPDPAEQELESEQEQESTEKQLHRWRRRKLKPS
jgi:eukaryotic-like serine/threonine-protein kinase